MKNRGIMFIDDNKIAEIKKDVESEPPGTFVKAVYQYLRDESNVIDEEDLEILMCYDRLDFIRLMHEKEKQWEREKDERRRERIRKQKERKSK